MIAGRDVYSDPMECSQAGSLAVHNQNGSFEAVVLNLVFIRDQFNIGQYSQRPAQKVGIF